MPFKASFSSEATKEKEFVQLLTTGIEAAMDAVNRYEQMTALAESTEVKNIFSDMAREEKKHAEKLRALLSKEDRGQEKVSEEGKRKVGEISSVGKVTVKVYEEPKATKTPRPVAEAEKPRQAPPVEKSSIKFQEEPRQTRPIEPIRKAGSATNTVKPKGDWIEGEAHSCSICGYKAHGPVPNRCPVCGASKDGFK